MTAPTRELQLTERDVLNMLHAIQARADEHEIQRQRDDVVPRPCPTVCAVSPHITTPHDTRSTR